MRVNGETTIFRNAHEGRDGTWYTYATGISSKRKDGTYANMYVDVRFRKGVTVPHRAKIDIKDGFLTVREFQVNGGDIHKRLEIMVLDFDYPSQDLADAPNQTEFTALSYEDVPF